MRNRICASVASFFLLLEDLLFLDLFRHKGRNRLGLKRGNLPLACSDFLIPALEKMTPHGSLTRLMKQRERIQISTHEVRVGGYDVRVAELVEQPDCELR